ncbi:MAG TPA: DUF1127 domain-containing protein [Dongiaceae bacterium]
MKYQATHNHSMLDLVPRSALAQIIASDLVPALDRMIEAPIAWLERMRERRQLAGLNDAMLKDIGVSRADVEHVVEKPFWRA